MKKNSFRIPLHLVVWGIIALNAPFSLAAETQAPPARAPFPAMDVATVPLWEGGAPGALGSGDADVPTLTVFLPRPGTGNGTAVIVAPGGAYRGLAINHEGRQVADWFAARGVTAFVLKYRLGQNYLYPVPLEDAQRAIRLVRSLRGQFNLAPDRIGMAGFSAGGHLTAMAGTSFDPGNPDAADPVERLSSRPDFLVLGYPWINAMQPAKPGMIASYQTLMKVPEEKGGTFETLYTPTLHVTANTPPTFIYITSDDGVVPAEASVEFYSALKAAGVQVEMHIFRHGAHGVGLGSGDPALELWPVLLSEWLRGQGLLTRLPVVANGGGRPLDRDK